MKHYSNFENQIYFEANKSSILIPSGINETKNCSSSSVASSIQNLDNYLLDGVSENYSI